LLAAVIGYLALQLAIGVWASRRVHTEDDYLVAGRRLGYPLALFSIFATWFGAETVIGAAGRAYRDGVSLASPEPFGYALCLVLVGLVFAAPLWRRGLTTLADLFRQRYSVGVERVAALVLVPSSLLWAAAQMRAFGHVLVATSTLNVEAALVLAAGFCVLYTAFGGLLADAVTDLVQGVLLIAGLGVVAIVAITRLGGADAAVASAAASGRLLAPGAGTGWLAALEAWAIPVCGSAIAAEIVARVIASRSPAVARRSSLGAAGLYLAVGLIPVGLGLAAGGLIPSAPADPEQFLPTLAREILPTAGYVLFAGAVLSAILSTVDSTLLVSAGLFSHNLAGPLLRLTDERARLRLARAGVVGFGVLAYVLARHAQGVYALVEQASALGGAGVLVTVCFALFTRWGGARTAYATLAMGLGVYAACALAAFPYPFLASLTLSLLTYVAGALLEPRAAV
jgi:Na+/proline symporter